MAGSPDVPFGGAKESGIGAQMGESSLEGYTQLKIIRVLKDAPPAKL